MNNQENIITQEEMDKHFKKMMFKALSENNPGVHMDEDGFIVLPTLIRRKRPSSSSGTDSPKKGS